MEFNFSGKISINDYIQYNRFIYRNITKMLCFAFFIYILIDFIMNLIKYYSNDNIINERSNKLFLIILTPILTIMVFLILFFIIEKLFMPIVYKFHFNSYKTFYEISEYKVNKENIKIYSESINMFLTKDKINKILYDKDTIYICLGINFACIVKKYFFKNSNEFDELKIFLNENYIIKNDE